MIKATRARLTRPRRASRHALTANELGEYVALAGEAAGQTSDLQR